VFDADETAASQDRFWWVEAERERIEFLREHDWLEEEDEVILARYDQLAASQPPSGHT
jgi:hypothetical protein